LDIQHQNSLNKQKSKLKLANFSSIFARSDNLDESHGIDSTLQNFGPFESNVKVEMTPKPTYLEIDLKCATAKNKELLDTQVKFVDELILFVQSNQTSAAACQQLKTTHMIKGILLEDDAEDPVHGRTISDDASS